MRCGTFGRDGVRVLGRALAMIAALGVSAGVVSLLTGCNTFKGVGRDVEAIAQGGQDIIDGK